MRVIESGHKYDLSILDGFANQTLTFVMRKGEKYPGNLDFHPGTTLQEVLRACLDRVEYLDKQIHNDRNTVVYRCLSEAIYQLEARAAERHGREIPSEFVACFGNQCPKCLHVECKGGCHADAA